MKSLNLLLLLSPLLILTVVIHFPYLIFLANMAKDQLTFSMIRGREIRILHYDRSLINQTKNNLFVKNVGLEATNLTLYNMFKVFGEVFSSKLAQDSKGRSKGFGFVQFRRPEDAMRAMNEMNGKMHYNQKLIVEQYKRKERNACSFSNIYVKNLPPSITTKEGLDKIFDTFGVRSSVAIFQREFKGSTCYFGFVNFKNPEDAIKACNQMHGKILEGLPLYAVRALTKDQREREKTKKNLEIKAQLRKVTLHIKSVSGDPLTEELVRQELEQFGDIRQISIRSQGSSELLTLPVGFVVFAAEENIKSVKYLYH